MSTILLVEDREGMRQTLAQYLAADGHTVITAEDGREGIKKVREARVDLVITDLKLPHKSGLEVLQAVKEHSPAVPVIVMTAFGTIETAVEAVKQGADDFLTKPIEPEQLLLRVGKALEKRRLVTENLFLREEVAKHLGFPRILGKSPAILEALDKVRKVAQGNTTVLLLGESGTGKELFARALHALSPRAQEPFVAINCAAIPRDLLESEFFGHERGAFTGATDRGIGKFELADRGTIFLDEIGELDLGLQAKLLRVLEGASFMRVGGTAKLQMDVRVVAASNRDLQVAIRDQRFREDLFYRISVFPVTIPPLRDRREDIPALVEHFIAYFSAELKKPSKTLSVEAAEVLKAQPWTGNVRELQNSIERAIILADGPTIRPEHLGLGRDADRVPSPPEEGGGGEGTETGSLQEAAGRATRAVESRLIREALAASGGNKTEAAKRLKVGYKTLLTKIKEYGIDK